MGRRNAPFMSHFEQPSWTRPVSTRSPGTTAPAGTARQAASLLRSNPGDTGGDTRKIRIGLLALALATVVVLNVGIYQGAQNQLVHDRCGKVADATDATRDRLRTVFQTADRQLRFAMDQPGFSAHAHAAFDGRLDSKGRQELQDDLNRTAGSFLLHHRMLVPPEGPVFPP